MVTAGDIGFAEGFLEEDWTTPDLTALIRLAARNGDALSPAIEGSQLMRLLNRTRHLLNANTTPPAGHRSRTSRPPDRVARRTSR